MKLWILAGGLYLALAFNPALASASEILEKDSSGVMEHGLSRIESEYREQIEKILAQYKGLADANREIKAAGGSFQKNLTLPVDNLSRYTTAVDQAQASGAYLFDAAYAALFMKKREMAQSLAASSDLNEKLGVGIPLPNKFKQIQKDPDAIRDYNTWSDAMNDLIDALIANGLNSEQRLCFVINYLYGSLIQGMYVVTETIAIAGFTPEMLQLMAAQRHRATLFLQLMNVFRGDADFERALGFDSRYWLLGQVHNLLLVNRFSRRDIDDIRRLIAPEHKVIMAQ